MAAGHSGQIPVVAKPFLILVFVSAFLNAIATHSASSYFFAPHPLIAIVHLSLYDLNVVLNDLKILTSRGCNLWLVWLGKVIISKPSAFAFCTTSSVTCDPCPSRISRCLFSSEIPYLSCTTVVKCEIQAENKKAVIQPFACMAMQASGSHLKM